MNRSGVRRLRWGWILGAVAGAAALWFCYSLWQGECLCFAIRRGDLSALRRNLEAGRSANSICVDGPPILWATIKGREDMIAVLLDHGADPDSIVLLAADMRQLGTLRMLHARGVDLWKPRGRDRATAMDVARRHGYPEIIAFLEAAERGEH